MEPGDQRVTLTRDEVPGRPRFRLTQDADAKLDITFALPPPGAPDFQTYPRGGLVPR